MSSNLTLLSYPFILTVYLSHPFPHIPSIKLWKFVQCKLRICFQIMFFFFFWLHSLFIKLLSRLCFTNNFLFLEYEPDGEWLFLNSCRPTPFTVIKLHFTEECTEYSQIEDFSFSVEGSILLLWNVCSTREERQNMLYTYTSTERERGDGWVGGWLGDYFLLVEQGSSF